MLSGIAITAEETRAKAAEQALAGSKQDVLTAGDGIIITSDNVIACDVESMATVEYVDDSINDTMNFIIQERDAEHAGRVAGDELIKADLAAEVSRAKGAEGALSDRLDALEMPMVP